MVKVKSIPVLVRDTATTTYHFGQSVPICEEQQSDRATPADVWDLGDALAHPRRLCRWCADLVASWSAAALSEASATDVVHPSR